MTLLSKHKMKEKKHTKILLQKLRITITFFRYMSARNRDKVLLR